MARLHTIDELKTRVKVLNGRPTETSKIEAKLLRKIRELENLKNS